MLLRGDREYGIGRVLWSRLDELAYDSDVIAAFDAFAEVAEVPTERASYERARWCGRQPAQDEGRLFDRNVLRHLLLHEVPVCFGSRLDAVDARPSGGVRAHFTDGRTEDADLLVGADGMGSTVRRQLLPQVQDVDLGIRGVIGRTPAIPRFDALVPGWSTFVLGDEIQLFLGSMRFTEEPRSAAARLAPDVDLPDTTSYIRWLTLLSADHPLVTDRDPESAVALLLELTRTWHPDIRSLIEQADRDNTGIGPLRLVDIVPAWGPGPVTLLGDALHPMPPGGLGANLAFQDARRLADLLTRVEHDGLNLSDALATYQSDALKYGAAARTQSLELLDRLVPDLRHRQ